MWKLSNSTVSQVATSQVYPNHSAQPSSHSARPIATCSASEGLTYFFGRCHLENCHLGSRPWENAFSKNLAPQFCTYVSYMLHMGKELDLWPNVCSSP